MTRDVVMIEAV